MVANTKRPLALTSDVPLPVHDFYNTNIRPLCLLSNPPTIVLAKALYFTPWREFALRVCMASMEPTGNIFRPIYSLRPFEPGTGPFRLRRTLPKTPESELGTVILLGMEKYTLQHRFGPGHGLRFKTIIPIPRKGYEPNIRKTRRLGGSTRVPLHLPPIKPINPLKQGPLNLLRRCRR